jgi:hypothetical protein
MASRYTTIPRMALGHPCFFKRGAALSFELARRGPLRQPEPRIRHVMGHPTRADLRWLRQFPGLHRSIDGSHVHVGD